MFPFVPNCFFFGRTQIFYSLVDLLGVVLVCEQNVIDPIVASKGQQPSRWSCSLGLSCHLHTEERRR